MHEIEEDPLFLRVKSRDTVLVGEDEICKVLSFVGGANNSIKGIFAGGATPTKQSTMSSIEIATTGNAVEFGDNKISNPLTSRGTCSDSHGGLT